MAEIRSLTSVLVGQMNNYQARLDTIMKSEFVQSAKERQAAALVKETVTGVVNVLANLWGQFQRTDGYLWMLSADGEVWASQARAFANLRNAREDAARPSYDATTMQARLAAILVTVGNDARAFSDYYKSQMSSGEREAAQDFLAGMVTLPTVASDRLAWSTVFSTLSRERAARLNTPAVQRATEALAAVHAETAEALAITKQVADRLAVHSGLIAKYPEAVGIEQRGSHSTHSPFAVQYAGDLEYKRRQITGLQAASDAEVRERLYNR